MDHLEFQIPHLWKGILIQPRYKPINMNLNNEKYVSECEITSVCVCKVTSLESDFSNSIDYSLPVSSVGGILQARILDRVAIPWGLPNLGIEPASPVMPAL